MRNKVFSICYTFGVKKIFFLIFVLILAAGTLWYAKRSPAPASNTESKTFRNQALGISFVYPKILSASSTPDRVVLHHEVPFTHHDYCDFKSELGTTVETLRDFNVSFYVVEKNIVDTMKKESPYIPEENFVNGAVVPSPGFIDPFTVNDLQGFKIFEGAEGCGHTKYFLSVSNSKTLVITEEWITVFSGAIDSENKASAEAVPGVINKEKEAQIFNSIMQSLKLD